MRQESLAIKPSISVIIAVYNVEEYIAQCCHSLFAQTLESIEYIFVDDCSPDNSIEVVKSILKEYPLRIPQVKILKHETNLGISKTREDGVNYATGEYIIHCDPDDWIDVEMYECLYRKAVSEKSDIVLCDVWYHYSNDPRPYYGNEKPKELTSRSLLASCFHLQYPIIHCYLCNKLIRFNLYDNIKWPEDISFCEDVVVCSQILMAPSLVISHVGKAFYHYRIKEQSLSHRANTKKDIDNDYKVISILYSHLCKSGDPDLYKIWQARVCEYMTGTLDAPIRYFSNREYAQRYRKYRNCIWKNKFISTLKKKLLYLATYNYRLAFFIYKASKKIKSVIS